MLPRSKFWLVLPLIIAAVIGISYFAFAPSGAVAVGEGVDPEPAYSKVAVDTGVWNKGLAAEWDLPFWDHFKIFGPEQRAAGYRPEQPIAFSHVTHVQKNKMECQYCHWTVSKSPYAVIPEMETCAGCHALPTGDKRFKGATEAKDKEIDKLLEHWKNKKPIPWVKVHVTPDYIRFNHKRHVKAGVTCQQCHGQVPKMEVVERVSAMKMGWCIDCHREKGASIDCYTCHY